MKRVLILTMIALLLPALAACGIPADAYDSAIKQRDKAQQELQWAKNETALVRAELNRVKAGAPAIDSTTSSWLTAQIAPRIELAEKLAAFDSLRAQATRARFELKDEAAAKSLDAQSLEVWKTFDPAVKNIGDSELSRCWAETWPAGSRQMADKEGRPMFVSVGYVKFLDRLGALLKDSRNQIQYP